MNKYSLVFQLVIIFLIGGCSYATQTTSGSKYLEDYENIYHYEKDEIDSNSFREDLKKAATVEPTLEFPARIGIARIDGRRITAIPEEEVEAWQISREKLGNKFGEFIPVSPLIAEMVSSEYRRGKDYVPAKDLINKLRLAAARQHLDAILIYEVFSNASVDSNFLSIANITIIGGYVLPSKSVNSKGIANAMLIDVLQAYPYGTAQAVVDKNELSSSWGKWEKTRELNEKTKIHAAIKLTKEVEKMFQNLRLELAENRLSVYRGKKQAK